MSATPTRMVEQDWQPLRDLEIAGCVYREPEKPEPCTENKPGFFVNNVDQGHVIGIPILPNGTAGMPWVVAAFPDVVTPDGLAIDVHGQLYVADIAVQAIVKVDPSDGTIQYVAAGDPLDYPSSVAFGTGNGERQTLFGVNFSIGELVGDVTVRAGPGLFAVDAGEPGNPLP